MREWPWVLTILGAQLASWLIPPRILDGWLSTILFWGSIIGAIAYAAHARRA